MKYTCLYLSNDIMYHKLEYGWMVKELVWGYEDESSIPSNDIPNLVLNDYNMTTCVLNDYKMITNLYSKCKSMWTIHSYFGHNLTPCHVEMLKQDV